MLTTSQVLLFLRQVPSLIAHFHPLCLMDALSVFHVRWKLHCFELGMSIWKLRLFPLLPFESYFKDFKHFCSIFPQFEGKFVTEISIQVCHFLCTQKLQLEQHTLMCSIFHALIRCIKCIKDQQMHLNFIVMC